MINILIKCFVGPLLGNLASINPKIIKINSKIIPLGPNDLLRDILWNAFVNFIRVRDIGSCSFIYVVRWLTIDSKAYWLTL